jgi:hypothetical protein
LTDQRKAKRFEMKLPLELHRAGSESLQEACETRNLSSGGVLFHTGLPIEVGDLIEYYITLPPNSAAEEPVRLRCRGKVLRRERAGDQAHVAASLERYEFVRAS